MEKINGYPKIYNLGHAAIREIFNEPVLVEEKVDGSQFSFGTYGGVFKCRSRGQQIDPSNPPKLFAKAVECVKQLPTNDGWTYRGEVLDKPKHNVLCYDRVPRHHFILFDVSTGLECWLSRKEKEDEAVRMGVEIVPVIGTMKIENLEDLKSLLDRESILGGQKVEGIVMKNYQRFGRDGKTMMAKLVSDKFKEQHKKDWKPVNNADIKESIAKMVCTEARWDKALIHLKESGELEDSPRDIPKIFKAVNQDIIEECVDEIKSSLWGWAKKDILKNATRGIPQWYKDKLLKKQFADD